MFEIVAPSSTSPALEILLTGEDIARILKVSRSYAYILMRRSEIPTVRLGRSVRVRPADLERFISKNVSKNEEL